MTDTVCTWYVLIVASPNKSDIQLLLLLVRTYVRRSQSALAGSTLLSVISGS